MLRVSGGMSLNWLSLQTALAVHFDDDVLVGRQPHPFTTFIYAGVTRAKFEQVSTGRDSWSISLGSRLQGLITHLRADGSPIAPPFSTEGLDTFIRQIQWTPAPSVASPLLLGKRQRPMASPPRSSTDPNFGARRPFFRGAPQAPTVFRGPVFRNQPRALVAHNLAARRGPGNL